MPSKKEYCFKYKNEDIYLFTLRNAKETEAVITNYGAILISFKIKKNDATITDVVLGFDDVKDYFSENYQTHYAYIGAACGRYANRIKNGRFVIDGGDYQLTQNMGNDQLHGGHNGFDRKVWKLVSMTDTSVELIYSSKDGEEGFPGNSETVIRFELNDNDELSYTFTATTDKTTAINLTHHSYFNLNNGAGTIEEHELKINASSILKQDEGLVCNGEYIPVQGTIYDFRKFKPVNKDWQKANGYDQCFIIDNKTDQPEPVAELRSPSSGITLQIISTEPAVQFYTGTGLGKLKGKQGIEYGPFSGLCLETHKHPNAVNIPHFPNTILKPGETYYQKTIYRVIQH